MADRPSREVRNLNALLDISRALGAEMHLDSLLPVIIKKTTEIMDAERSSLFFYDVDSDELWSKVAEGIEEIEIRFPSGLGIAGDVAKTLLTANIPDAYDDPRFNREFDKKTNFRTKAILCMPITTRKGELIGVIEVLNKSSTKIATGFSNYSSEECEEIIGRPSSEIEDLLGFSREPEVVHRDNLVLA